MSLAVLTKWWPISLSLLRGIGEAGRLYLFLVTGVATRGMKRGAPRWTTLFVTPFFGGGYHQGECLLGLRLKCVPKAPGTLNLLYWLSFLMIISFLNAFCLLDSCSSATFLSLSSWSRRSERSASFFAFLPMVLFMSAVGRRDLGNLSFMDVWVLRCRS